MLSNNGIFSYLFLCIAVAAVSCPLQHYIAIVHLFYIVPMYCLQDLSKHFHKYFNILLYNKFIYINNVCIFACFLPLVHLLTYMYELYLYCALYALTILLTSIVLLVQHSNKFTRSSSGTLQLHQSIKLSIHLL